LKIPEKAPELRKSSGLSATGRYRWWGYLTTQYPGNSRR
jgi:hypothetical protein